MNFEFKPAFNKNNIPIFFSTDENYAPYLAVAIKSIFINRNLEDCYDIIVLHTSIPEHTQNKISSSCVAENFSIRFINIDKYLINDSDKIKYTCYHYSVAMYYRIFISDIFTCYNKAIYLDCDLIVQKDISELFKIDISTAVLGAILDFGAIQFNNSFISKKYCKDVLRINNETYFNSGVLLINCQKFRAEKIKEKCLNILQKIKTPKAPDQDILNVACYNQIKYFPLKYNFEWHYPIKDKNYINTIPQKHHADFLDAESNTFIIHYTSCKKPWKEPQLEYANYFWECARQTPFYEEILLRMVQSNTVIPNVTVNKEMVKHITQRFKYRLRYLKYKLLKPFVFGKLRKKYKSKKKKYKQLLKQIKNYLK